MAFDAFGLRDHVVREYRDYVESFIIARFCIRRLGH
jgi:hypothetical protein